jgi:adenylate cyclase
MNQPDHAKLACRAALAMIAEMPTVSAKWQPLVGSPLKLGVGLNTGHAMVGNTGNEYKTKYGPLGHTVNLASRVEGATKQLEVPILITGSTREQLGEEFITRRLCQVRVVGIAGKVDLCEVSSASSGEAGWADRCKAYETALENFENRHFAEACRMLYPLLSHKGGFDIPSLNLLTRSVQAMKESAEDFDAVLELRQK